MHLSSYAACGLFITAFVLKGASLTNILLISTQLYTLNCRYVSVIHRYMWAYSGTSWTVLGWNLPRPKQCF